MERGFTLMELVSVLALAGVLAAVAAPRMLNPQGFNTRGGAAEIRTALRYAQQVAMARNREVCVGLAPTGLALNVNPLTTPGAACSQPVERPGAGDPYVVSLPGGVGVTPALGFRFDGQGRPVPNVTLNLTVGGTVPIVVTRETGRVQ
jgi:MSHA pilin protein MshC